MSSRSFRDRCPTLESSFSWATFNLGGCNMQHDITRQIGQVRAAAQELATRLRTLRATDTAGRASLDVTTKRQLAVHLVSADFLDSHLVELDRLSTELTDYEVRLARALPREPQAA